jgi:DNA-nicking Smr family endonuclease
VLARKVKSGDLSQVEVSYAVEGRGGPAPVKISRERMPLSDFLNTFGLTIEDVKKQLK